MDIVSVEDTPCKGMTSDDFRKWYDEHGLRESDVVIVRSTIGGHWNYQRAEVWEVEAGRTKFMRTSLGNFYRSGKLQDWRQFCHQRRLVAPTPEALAAAELPGRSWYTGVPWVD